MFQQTHITQAHRSLMMRSRPHFVDFVYRPGYPYDGYNTRYPVWDDNQHLDDEYSMKTTANRQRNALFIFTFTNSIQRSAALPNKSRYR